MNLDDIAWSDWIVENPKPRFLSVDEALQEASMVHFRKPCNLPLPKVVVVGSFTYEHTKNEQGEDGLACDMRLTTFARLDALSHDLRELVMKELKADE